MKQNIIKSIAVPEGVDVDVAGDRVAIKNPPMERRFILHNVSLKKEGNSIILMADNATKREKKIIGSVAAHIKNMLSQQLFEYRLQICSVHFPINVSIDKSANEVVIKNFLGETKERRAKIIANVDTKIQGDIIVVSSRDKEAAGQTAANIEVATRISMHDRRVFQDGIFMTQKAGRKI